MRSKLRLRPWRPGDEDAFEPRADFAEERAANAWDWTKGAPGPTWTLERLNGEIVGIAGAIGRDRDIWDVWAQLADLPRRDWPQLLVLAERVLAYLETQRGATALIAQARRAFPAAERCLRKLRFGDSHSFGPYQRMVRL